MTIIARLAVSLLLICSMLLPAGANAADPLTNPSMKIFTSAGTLAAGYRIHTYEEGTTTPKVTYTTADESTPNTNPVCLDSVGEAPIYATGPTKLVLEEPTTGGCSDINHGTVVWTKDPVLPAGSSEMYVDTIAALRARIGTASGQTIKPEGYYVIGDTNIPTYYWATGAAPGTYTDNGGSIIVPTGGDGSEAWTSAPSGPIDVRTFGAKCDGVTDDSSKILSITAIPNSVVELPAGKTCYTGTTTIAIRSGQEFFGHGKGSSFIKSDAAIAVATADADGDYDVTTKASGAYINLHDFSILADATNAIGLRVAGASYSTVRDIDVSRSTDAKEVAGSRTGVGIHIGGLAQASQNGQYYTNISGISASWFGTCFVYGPRTHSNGAITGVDFHYCDTGALEDNGTAFSYAVGTAYPVMFNMHGGSIEQIYGTGIDLNSDVTTYRSFSDLYIEGMDVGIAQVTGRTTLDAVRFNTIANYGLQISGGTVSGRKSATTTDGKLVGKFQNLDAAPTVVAMYDSANTFQGISNPRLVSGVAVITGDGVKTYASTTVTFASLDADLTAANLTIAGVWGNCVGSTTAGINNALYNVGFSDISLFGSDNDLQVNIIRVDGAAITDIVLVQWFALVYIP